MIPSRAAQPNHLIHEKSPYLLQHAYNPVEWYPWGDDAFAKARQEQKPIFLSIGYSTCHWCHVMERESFENAEIAALLNRSFISVKVDREEHPDVDQVYMTAVTAMTGQGGWPLTAFLTPDLKPFFGGTYFPPEARWNRPGMKELLPAVAEAWQQRRDELVHSADRLTSSLHEALSKAPPAGPVTPALLDAAYAAAREQFDATTGGFGEAPKFPRSHELSFLLRYWRRTGEPDALQMVTTTLDAMACGGIRDHLGGGFHRYATDAQWLVPHFEKMLYDQALLAMTYLEAFRATHRPVYAEVAREILEYVLRDLSDPEGGFYAAEDADSEGEEGTYYVWTPEEILKTLGADAGERFNRVYGVTAEGQFEQGTSILHLEPPLEASLPEAAALAADRQRLLEARNRRVRPHRDDKILTSWNGLMIAAMAYGGATLDEPRYVRAAERSAAFILQRLQQDGRLLRRYRDGDARYAGTLEDYAFFSHGLVELYQASGHPRWLAEAKRLAAQMAEQFWDPDRERFVLRNRQASPLIVQADETYDGATPSGSSVAIGVLLRIGRLTADDAMEARVRHALERVTGRLAQAPFGSPVLLSDADLALGPPQEIVIAGDPASADTAALWRVVHAHFLPHAVLIGHAPGPSGAEIETLASDVTAQGMMGGRATAYVCERFVCRLPVTDPDQLRAILR